MPLCVPSSLNELLFLFRECFTAPSYETFRVLTVGFLTRVGVHTVTGTLIASRASFTWHHSRAHRFFSRALWSVDELGLGLAELIITRLVAADATIEVAVDDTLLKRCGRKVFGRYLHYDAASGAVGRTLSHGNCWVVLGIVVQLRFMERPVCLPILFRLWHPGDAERTKVLLARELAQILAKRFPERKIALCGDCAYAAKGMRELSDTVTLTTRLRSNAALYLPQPDPTGRRGRPRVKGERLPSLAGIADDPYRACEWQKLDVVRYGKRETVSTLVVNCLWYSVLKDNQAQLVLVREQGTDSGYDLALISTDLNSDATCVIERYATRWSIEVAFEDSKQLAGVGQARNRVPKAVERTAPFGFFCLSLTVVWYALYGHSSDDVAEHRARARWYTTKRNPSVADMLAKLRRVIIAQQYLPTRPREPTCQEIEAVTAAWALGGM